MIAAYIVPEALSATSYPRESGGALGTQVLLWALGALIRGPYLKFLLSLGYAWIRDLALEISDFFLVHSKLRTKVHSGIPLPTRIWR